MRFIHIADLHLDSPLAGLREKAGERATELVGATRRAFFEFVDFAVDERVDLVLIAGDLFDGDWRDYTTGIVFNKGMARLKDAAIPVALISGNHDADSQITRKLRLPENVRRLSTKKAETWEIDHLNVAIHGRGFAEREVTENFVPDFPAPIAGRLNIGLLHTSADLTNSDHKSYAPCRVADMVTKGYGYWALGHVHTRTVLCQDPWIVFPGNLQGRNIRETGPHGFALVTVGDAQVTSVEFVDVDVVRWAAVNVDVTGAATFDAACDRISAEVKRAVGAAEGRVLAVRVTITGETPVHRHIAGDLERLSAECISSAAQADGDVWVERVDVRTRPVASIGPAAADAVAEIESTLRAVRSDQAEREEVRRVLVEALQKIPAGLTEAVGIALDDEAEFDRIIEQAEALVLERLFASEVHA